MLKPQSKWRWLIAAYLFLAGLGAGAYVVGAVAGFFGDPAWAGIARIGVSLGFPCVAIGCLLLIADLGTPLNFWRAAMRPNTSWIARGTIIITSFMVLGTIHFALSVWPSNELARSTGARQILSVLGILFAFGTMVYTGILLAASRPIAFWSTALLPLLFLVSALSTGIMAIVLIGSLAGSAYEQAIEMLARIDVILILLEAVVLAFFLQGTHRVSESRASAELVLRGEVAPLFWWGVVILGLATPLGLEIIGIALGGAQARALALAASACGIAGGLCLRQVVLCGGIHAPLRAGRFEVGLPIV